MLKKREKKDETKLKELRKKLKDVIYIDFVLSALLVFITLQSDIGIYISAYSISSVIFLMMLYIANRNRLEERMFMLLNGIMVLFLSSTLGIFSVMMNVIFINKGVFEFIALQVIGVAIMLYWSYQSVNKKLEGKSGLKKENDASNKNIIAIASLLGIFLGRFLIKNIGQFGKIMCVIVCFMFLQYLFGFIGAKEIMEYKMKSVKIESKNKAS